MPKLGFFLLKLGLAAAAVAYVGHLVAWGAVVEAARAAKPGWVAAALVLVPVNVGLEAYRWHRLVRRLVPEVRFAETLGAVLCGYPLGLATPGRVGDYAGRAFYLGYAGTWELAALTFAERMATLACSLAVGLAALVPFLAGQTDLPALAWAAVGAAGGLSVVTFVWLVLHPGAARRWLTRLVPRRFAHRLGVLGRFNRRDARSLLGLSALRYGIYSAQFVLLVFAFEPRAAWAAAAQGVALVFFAQSVIPSFTLAGLGIREGAAVYFLGALGVGAAAAFGAALGLFFLNLVLPALVGVPFVLRLRLAPEPAPAEVRA